MVLRQLQALTLKKATPLVLRQLQALTLEEEKTVGLNQLQAMKLDILMDIDLAQLQTLALSAVAQLAQLQALAMKIAPDLDLGQIQSVTVQNGQATVKFQCMATTHAGSVTFTALPLFASSYWTGALILCAAFIVPTTLVGGTVISHNASRTASSSQSSIPMTLYYTVTI